MEEGAEDDQLKEGEEEVELKDGEEEVDDESQKEAEKVDEDFIKLQETMIKTSPEKKLVYSWSVTEFDDEYGIMLNPESLFEKHCILHRKEDISYYNKIFKNKTCFDNTIQDTKKIFKRKDAYNKKVYYDFSRISKFRQKKVLDYNMFVEQEQVYNQGVSNLNSRFVNFESLFTLTDMNMILKSMKELDAYMLYSILPDGESDYKQYVNNTVHIIPRESFLNVTNVDNQGYNLNNILDMEGLFIDDLGVKSDENVRLHNEEMERR